MRTLEEVKALADMVRAEMEAARRAKRNEAVRDGNTLYLDIMGNKQPK